MVGGTWWMGLCMLHMCSLDMRRSRMSSKVMQRSDEVEGEGERLSESAISLLVPETPSNLH